MGGGQVPGLASLSGACPDPGLGPWNGSMRGLGAGPAALPAAAQRLPSPDDNRTPGLVDRLKTLPPNFDLADQPADPGPGAPR